MHNKSLLRTRKQRGPAELHVMRMKTHMEDRIFLFDWGDTLMVDFPGVPGKMCDWEHVEKTFFAEEALKKTSSFADIYIATAAAESTYKDIEKAFKRVGLSKYINGYFCKQNTGFTKPSLGFYKAILEKLSVAPSSVTMVGDNLEKDILPCHEIGLKTVLITNDIHPKTPQGTKIINNLSELCS